MRDARCFKTTWREEPNDEDTRPDRSCPRGGAPLHLPGAIRGHAGLRRYRPTGLPPHRRDGRLGRGRPSRGRRQPALRAHPAVRGDVRPRRRRLPDAPRPDRSCQARREGRGAHGLREPAGDELGG